MCKQIFLNWWASWRWHAGFLYVGGKGVLTCCWWRSGSVHWSSLLVGCYDAHLAGAVGAEAHIVCQIGDSGLTILFPQERKVFAVSVLGPDPQEFAEVVERDVILKAAAFPKRHQIDHRVRPIFPAAHECSGHLDSVVPRAA